MAKHPDQCQTLTKAQLTDTNKPWSHANPHINNSGCLLMVGLLLIFLLLFFFFFLDFSVIQVLENGMIYFNNGGWGEGIKISIH